MASSWARKSLSRFYVLSQNLHWKFLPKWKVSLCFLTVHFSEKVLPHKSQGYRMSVCALLICLFKYLIEPKDFPHSSQSTILTDFDFWRMTFRKLKVVFVIERNNCAKITQPLTYFNQAHKLLCRWCQLVYFIIYHLALAFCLWYQ